MMKLIMRKLRAYWTLIKSLQTGLLLITGLAAYSSARCPVTTWETWLAVSATLFLAISGSTVLNMVYDRDLDARMQRACRRPLPSGKVSAREALLLGLGLSVAGVGGAVWMSPLYGAIVFAGLFFDVVIYTIWLKRRTPYSIVIGGLAGGMPALAGRALAVGQVDAIGILLAAAVLLWIPTHILTFNIKHADDYARAGVPTFPAAYGVRLTRLIVTLSSLGAAIAILIAALGVGMTWGYLRLLLALTAGLLALALASMLRPGERMNFALFKYASVYMLGSMVLFSAEAI